MHAEMKREIFETEDLNDRDGRCSDDCLAIQQAALRRMGNAATTSQRPPKILMAATMRWPLGARLAMAFRALGCSVSTWTPKGHPLETVTGISRRYTHHWLRLQHSLRVAIEADTPDLIIPCDDETALTMEALYRACHPVGPTSTVHRAIGDSLGRPQSCNRATQRGELMRTALSCGIRVPKTVEIRSLSGLDTWTTEHGFPAVIKTDCTSGGRGVAVVRNRHQAHVAFARARRSSWGSVLADLALRRDAAPLVCKVSGKQPKITAQRFIEGLPANRAVACWQGKVLAGNSVLTLESDGPTGPATVVHVINYQEMTLAAEKLVHALGLSGLCGLDFIIEKETGAAYLIELNPRATPICHLPLGNGCDLPSALYACLRQQPVTAHRPVIKNEIIAMFPGEWRRDHRSIYFKECYHDVPWAETALVADSITRPWNERGWVTQLRIRLQPERYPALPLFPPLSNVLGEPISDRP